MGGKRQPRSAPAQSSEGYRRKTRRAPAQGRIAQAGRLGRQLHAVGARHGAAHDAADGRASRPRAGADGRAAGRPIAAAHDAGAAAADRDLVRSPAARQIRSRQGGRRQRRRDRWPGRRRHADHRGNAAGAGAAGARPVIRRAGLFAPAAHRGRCDAGAGGERQFSCRTARRRHRLGQDRSLFRSGCRDHPARQAGVDPDAGDRADRAIPRSLRAAFRRAAAGMAFRTDAAHPRAQLGGDCGGRGECGGGRAVRAVHALRQSWADRGR